MYITKIKEVFEKRKCVYLSSINTPIQFPIEHFFFKIYLGRAIRDLASNGSNIFITDLYDDFSLVASEMVLQKRKYDPSIQLVVVIPHYYGYFRSGSHTDVQLQPMDTPSRVTAIIRQADYVYCEHPLEYRRMSKIKLHNYGYRLCRDLCDTAIAYYPYNTRKVISTLVTVKKVINLLPLVKNAIELYESTDLKHNWSPINCNIDSKDSTFHKENTIFFDFKSLRKSNCGLFRKQFFMQALEQAIREEIANGNCRFILYLNDMYQVMAGEILIRLRKEFDIQIASIMCQQKRSCFFAGCDIRKAKGIFKASDFKHYFERLPLIDYYIFMAGACKKAIVFDINNDLIHFLGEKNSFQMIKRNMDSAVTTEFYAQVKNEFIAYFKFATGADDCLCQKIDSVVSAFPLKKQATIFRRYIYYRNNYNGLSSEVISKLQFLDDHLKRKENGI